MILSGRNVSSSLVSLVQSFKMFPMAEFFVEQIALHDSNLSRENMKKVAWSFGFVFGFEGSTVRPLAMWSLTQLPRPHGPHPAPAMGQGQPKAMPSLTTGIASFGAGVCIHDLWSRRRNRREIKRFIEIQKHRKNPLAAGPP